MNPVPKCLLLPIDESEDSLKPVEFLTLLYPERHHVSPILSYFLPPLSPIYRQKPSSSEMGERKKELIHSRKEAARAVLDSTRKILTKAGFSEEAIQEHIQEKELSASQHACRLADVKKVDAVIVQKRISNRLEGFLKGDPAPALLQHCLTSPIWFVEGKIDPSKAAVCVYDEEASLRAVDHAAFMLAETRASITLLYLSSSVPAPITVPAFDAGAELRKWEATEEGKRMKPFLDEARQIMQQADIDKERVQITILPCRKKVNVEILSYCKQSGTGIVVLGHSDPGGTWGFLKGSVTKKILSDFKDMAVWVNQ